MAFDGDAQLPSGAGSEPISARITPAAIAGRRSITILDPGAVEQALNRLQHAEVRRTTRDVDQLGDAIVMREREKSRQKRMKQTPENAGIIDAIGLIQPVQNSSGT